MIPRNQLQGEQNSTVAKRRVDIAGNQRYESVSITFSRPYVVNQPDPAGIILFNVNGIVD